MACIGHTNRLQVLKSHPRGPSVLFTAGWDSTVQCWDLRTSKSQVHISGPKVFGGALDIARDRMLVGSHGRRWDALRVYDLRTGNSMAARRPRLTVGVLCGPLRPVVRPLLLRHWNAQCLCPAPGTGTPAAIICAKSERLAAKTSYPMPLAAARNSMSQNYMQFTPNFSQYTYLHRPDVRAHCVFPEPTAVAFQLRLLGSFRR
jgi:hypothetical protein